MSDIYKERWEGMRKIMSAFLKLPIEPTNPMAFQTLVTINNIMEELDLHESGEAIAAQVAEGIDGLEQLVSDVQGH